MDVRLALSLKLATKCGW